jgi:hypothetical protein
VNFRDPEHETIYSIIRGFEVDQKRRHDEIVSMLKQISMAAYLLLGAAAGAWWHYG